jgi:hypothetical protein
LLTNTTGGSRRSDGGREEFEVREKDYVWRDWGLWDKHGRTVRGLGEVSVSRSLSFFQCRDYLFILAFPLISFSSFYISLVLFRHTCLVASLSGLRESSLQISIFLLFWNLGPITIHHLHSSFPLFSYPCEIPSSSHTLEFVLNT